MTSSVAQPWGQASTSMSQCQEGEKSGFFAPKFGWVTAQQRGHSPVSPLGTPQVAFRRRDVLRWGDDGKRGGSLVLAPHGPAAKGCRAGRYTGPPTPAWPPQHQLSPLPSPKPSQHPHSSSLPSFGLPSAPASSSVSPPPHSGSRANFNQPHLASEGFGICLSSFHPPDFNRRVCLTSSPGATPAVPAVPPEGPGSGRFPAPKPGAAPRIAGISYQITLHLNPF